MVGRFGDGGCFWSCAEELALGVVLACERRLTTAGLASAGRGACVRACLALSRDGRAWPQVVRSVWVSQLILCGVHGVSWLVAWGGSDLAWGLAGGVRQGREVG